MRKKARVEAGAPASPPHDSLRLSSLVNFTIARAIGDEAG